MIKWTSWSSLTLALLFSLGCTSTATVESQPISFRNAAASVEAGLTYALPKRLVRLTIKGTPPSTKIDEDLAKAKKAVTDANKALKDAQNASMGIKEALDVLTRAGAAGTILQKKAAELALASAAVSKAKAVLSKAKSTHSELLAQVQDPSNQKSLLSAKVELLPPIPDAYAWYLAKIRPDIMRDDVWDLDTTEAGLLSNASSRSTDRIADVLVDLAGIGGLLLGSPGDPADDVPADPCQLGTSFAWHFDFDPAAGSIPVNQALRACEFPLQINVGIAATSQPKEEGEVEVEGKRASVDGLVYRRPIPYTVSVSSWVGTPDDRVTIQSTVFMLPQGGPEAVLAYDADPFVKSITNTTFVNGQPTKWHAEKPSEVAAAFRIPVAMAKALVSVPGELIKLRVDYSNNKTALLEAQKDYVCALEELQRTEGKPTTTVCEELNAVEE